MLSDTTMTDFRRVSRPKGDGNNGVIAIVGPRQDALELAEELLKCDHFDNVDGRRAPDGLPDFAGETVAVMSDDANAPYFGYVAASNEEFLRELNVRNFIESVDTVCHLGGYDGAPTDGKRGAKVVVLASSYSSAYGYEDILALSNACGGRIKVVSPVHSMFDYAVRKFGDSPAVAVWATESALGAGIYSTVAATSSLEDGAKWPDYDLLCPDWEEDAHLRILSFLRMYDALDRGRKLDAVLVDEAALSAAELNKAMGSLWESVPDSLLSYRSLVSDRFEFIDAKAATSAECFRYLREANVFTHKVAYPACEYFVSIPVTGLQSEAYGEDGKLTESFMYGRSCSFETSTYRFIKVDGMEDGDMADGKKEGEKVGKGGGNKGGKDRKTAEKEGNDGKEAGKREQNGEEATRLIEEHVIEEYVSE